MSLELPEQARKEAIVSLQRYFEVNLPEPIGNLGAGLLLNFFLEEIAPLVYNKAVSDAQSRMQQNIADLEGDLYEDSFQYWPKRAAKRKS